MHTDNPPRSAARKSPLTLEMLRERGGRVFTEPTPFGVGSFAELDGTRYYLAAKSQSLWDTSCPPPSSCSRCGPPLVLGVHCLVPLKSLAAPRSWLPVPVCSGSATSQPPR